MAWDQEKAKAVLTVYGAQFLVVNTVGMVCVPTAVGLIELDGYSVDNEQSELMAFNPGIASNGDEPSESNGS